jgi:hypothetical protein
MYLKVVRKHHYRLDQLLNEYPTFCGRSGFPDRFYVDLRQHSLLSAVRRGRPGLIAETRKPRVQGGETRKPYLVPQKSWWGTPNDAEGQMTRKARIQRRRPVGATHDAAQGSSRVTQSSEDWT